MNLPEFGVKRPVTNLMIFFAILVMALYSLTRLGIDSMPEIEPPVISVISSYPGASPEDVEIKVTEELENQLATTPGLEKITSYSSEGTSVIQLKFIWGTNLDEASNDIRDRIELAKRALPDIPDEMDNPFIFKFNTSNIPILMIGFTAKQTYSELYDLIDKKVGDALRQLPGVGTVQFQGGGLERQINIWIDKYKLEGHGFSVLDVKNVLKQENITQPVGNLKSGMTEYLVRLPGEFKDPAEINTLVLGRRNGKTIYLRDVVRVEDSFKEVKTIVRINKERALMMMIQKQSGVNTVEVAERVKKRLKELERILPADVKQIKIFDTSKDIIDSLNSLKSSVWVGIFLVVFVVWFFLRQFAASMIIALTIPFSLLISFIYLFLSGKTINTISLSSLAIASGMVVDNAIVIVDNIYRHLERGQRVKEAAIFGAREMFLSVAASTLTTVVVFMPMLFIPGVVGIIFGELAVIVTVTLIASLFTAVTFSPMLCSKWMQVKNGAQKKNPIFQRFYDFSEKIFVSLENFYSRMLGFALHHKKLVLLGFLAAFVSCLFLVPLVGNEFIPEEDTGDVRLTISLPIGTRVEESDKLAAKIEDVLLKEIPEATYYYVRSGSIAGIGRVFGNTSGSHVIVAGVKLVPKTQRKRSVKDVAHFLREKVKTMPGVLKTDISTGNPIGRLITGGGGKAIQIEIIGHSFEETDTFAKKIKDILDKIPGSVDVSISRESNLPELIINVDREKTAVLGLDMNTIAGNLKTYIEGASATKYREKGKTYDIYVRLEEPLRTKIEDIENLSIVPLALQKQLSVAGISPIIVRDQSIKQIKLSSIAKIEETLGPQEIERKNRERVVRIECNAYKRSAGKLVEEFEGKLKKLVIPSDISVSIGGEAEEQRKAFKDLTLLLILGIFLVYMVMAAQFESLLDPFIIMFSIPFTFIGVILGFILTGVTLSIVSFLGIVMLMGIVVNNAIVLISYIILLRTRGKSMFDAVTLAGKDRLRPILMTTITTLAGLLPLALSQGEGSETWQPLGVTMFGGLTLSTLITLIFVPVLYAVFHKKSK